VAERGHALEGRERARERIGLESVVLECVEGVKNAGSAHARLEFLRVLDLNGDIGWRAPTSSSCSSLAMSVTPRLP
jgi:hypothetical protein